RGLVTVEAQLVTYRKNEVLFNKEVGVLKREVGIKQYEINTLKTEFEKIKQEKDAFDFKIKKFDKALKDLDQILENNSKENSDKSLVKEQESHVKSSFVKGCGSNTNKSVSEVEPKFDGLPKFKYGKDHLFSACERGKSKKASHPPKLIPSDYSKLELLHMDLCGPMRVALVNGKKYILVIVDDFSRFT
ncbi:retrovirus-related pol polyprotein from transposon TNT 1-94, partial [Tanacetum coccineum]